MDGLSELGADGGDGIADEPRMEPPPAIGGDERRMHVRAYNHWVSLLNGRPCPPVDDIDPARIEDFGANSVLLDFTAGSRNPAIAFLGRALRDESGHEGMIACVDDVPSQSLLARLAERYPELLDSRAPVGFEAEFVNPRGFHAMYRGILLPFSSNGSAIDFVYGVINWKEVAADAMVRGITAELARGALARPAPPPRVQAVSWADGPNAGPRRGVADDDADRVDADALADRLGAARASAELAAAAEARGRAALHRALGTAYDFLLDARRNPDGRTRLLRDARLRVPASGLAIPIVKLVFGADHDPARLALYASVLAYGLRMSLEEGDMPQFLESHPDGITGVAAAERAARRTALKLQRNDGR